jgi:hypothetical protein
MKFSICIFGGLEAILRFMLARNFAAIIFALFALSACQISQDPMNSLLTKSKEVATDLEIKFDSITSSSGQIFRSLSFARRGFIEAVAAKNFKRADDILGSNKEFFLVPDDELKRPIEILAEHFLTEIELASIQSDISSVNIGNVSDWKKYPLMKSKFAAAKAYIVATNVYALFPGKFHHIRSIADIEASTRGKFEEARARNFTKYSILEPELFTEIYPGFNSEHEKQEFFRGNLSSKKIGTDLANKKPKPWKNLWERLNNKGYLNPDETKFIWLNIVKKGVAAFKVSDQKHRSLRELVVLSTEARQIAEIETESIEISELINLLPNASLHEWIELLNTLNETEQFPKGQITLTAKLKLEIIPNGVEIALLKSEFAQFLSEISRFPGDELKNAVPVEIVLSQFKILPIEKQKETILSSWKHLNEPLKTTLVNEYIRTFHRENMGINGVEIFTKVATEIKDYPFGLSLHEIVKRKQLESDLRASSFTNLGNFLRADEIHNVLGADTKSQIVISKMANVIAREFTTDASCSQTIQKIRSTFGPVGNSPINIDDFLRSRVGIFFSKSLDADFEIGFSAPGWTIKEFSDFDPKSFSGFLGICLVSIETASLNTKVLLDDSVHSEMVIGNRSVPNSAYRQAEQAYQSSLVSLRRAEASSEALSNSSAPCSGNVWACALAGGLKGLAAETQLMGPQNLVEENRKRLSRTPMFYNEKIRQPYQYKRENIRSAKEVGISVHKISIPKRQYVSFTIKKIFDRTFNVVSNVDPRDPNFSSLTSQNDAPSVLQKWDRENIDLQLSNLSDQKPSNISRGELEQAPFLQLALSKGVDVATSSSTGSTTSGERHFKFSVTPIALMYPQGPPRRHDVAVIIGNGNYEDNGSDIPNIGPAYADAAGFRQFAGRILGISEDNTIFIRDAAQADMIATFGSESDHRGRLFDIVKPGKSKVFIYYSGHGAPGDKGKRYLVPVDARGSRIRLNGYGLKTFYRNLSKLPALEVTVVLEACFSGISPGGKVVPSASGIYLTSKENIVPTSITVIAAGASDQIASWEKDNSHGLFTKYFLKGMSGQADELPNGDGNGTVTFIELDKYFKGTVTSLARRYYGRDQVVQIVSPKVNLH